MLTRRVFLAASAAGTLAALPPAIAALPNRRGEAHPISLAERESRVDRARSLMRANRIDAIVLAGGTSLDYFTGIRWGNSERLFAFILPQKGNPFYIAPSFEEERLRERMSRDSRMSSHGTKTRTRMRLSLRRSAMPASQQARQVSRNESRSSSPMAFARPPAASNSSAPHPSQRDAAASRALRNSS